MQINATLRNQPQIGQIFQQFGGNWRAFTKQYDGVETGQPVGQCTFIIKVIIENSYVQTSQFFETWQMPQGIKPIIKDRDFHDCPSQMFAGTKTLPAASLRHVRSRPADLCSKP